MNSVGVPFFQRQKVRETGLILSVLVFFAVYETVSPVSHLIDRLVDPAVEGLTFAYGTASTWIQKATGLNLGFVQEEPDQDFLFSVRLATYVNQRAAAPLLEIATDNRVSNDKRERALRSLLKFESTADWVQPFLNELPKGGMLGLYDKTTPAIDDLIKKLRAEGGLRQPLVRAYAEVVFSFMMQVPDAIIRQHSLRWVSDVLAEDALFLIIPRIDKETDPDTQASIEAALLDVRAVSDPDTARTMLINFYKKPPWPSLRFPLGIVLARLGYDPAMEYLHYVIRNEKLTEVEEVATRVAMAGTKYPRELKMSEPEERLIAKRAADRQDQLAFAIEKRERMKHQEEVKRAILAQHALEENGTTIPENPPAEAQAPAETSEVASAPAQPETEAAAPAQPPVAAAPAEPAQPLAAPAAESRRPRRVARTMPKASAPETSQAVANPAAEVQEARIPEPAAAPAVPRVAAPQERVAPKPFAVPGELTPEEKAAQKAARNTQVARLPEDVLPPPLEAPAEKKTHSLMNYVDVVFETKDDTPLFQNPGEKKSDAGRLPKGTKGKADFEVMIGEERWYQVKTKNGNGWLEASHVSAFNLAPDNVVPAVAAKPASPVAGDTNIDGSRKESTYFEATTEDVPVYAKPSERAKVVSKLQMGTVYLAVKSEKVGATRWFLLQLKSGETGWVLGDINLQLANVVQPAQLNVPTKPMSVRNHEPWFAAGWVVAGVKGVGVYERQSIGSTLMTTIDPGPVYRVVETTEGEGDEWYRIQLSGRREGWVQAMDVKITKEPAK